jgi:predicted RecA/RadA family phage recombinase
VVAPSGGVLSGQFIVVGHLAGVASYDAAAGAVVELAINGVFDLLKASGVAVNQGDRIYWDSVAKNCTTTVGSNTLIGAATEAAGTSTATVRTRLNGISV